MTIIVFLIDNSASMNQRTVQGTTLLDVAKTATELFFKIRLSKSRVDRYFIVTLDSENNYIKLAGWRQNVDLQCLHVALNNIKANGRTSLEVGIQRTFRMLNLNRLQLGLENYGMGMYPSFIEPAVVLCITDGCSNPSSDDSFLRDSCFSSIESAVFGHVLTDASFRWDYRLYSLILRYPAFLENFTNCNRLMRSTQSPGILTSELTGGRSFIISDNRELQQCLENLAPKCQPAVIVDFSLNTDPDCRNANLSRPTTYKQMIYVKLMGRVCSSWPIPETFWPDDDLVATHLPSRPAHPHILVSNTQVPVPEMPDYFPVDKYDLEPSSFTKHLCNYDPNKVWQCFGSDKKQGQDAPFGYLKLSPDSQTAQLHVLPYNYPVFCKLLTDLREVHHMHMTETWGHQFVNYLSSIPRYYFIPLTKTFERFGFQSVIKPEAIDRILPYQLKHSLQKLRHAAKIEYDNFVRSTSKEEETITVTLPSSLLPLPLWSLRDIRPDTGNRPMKNAMTQPYFRAIDIDRRKLRSYLRKMRQNLNTVLSGGMVDRNCGLIHQQPVAAMGDYVNYRASREKDPPLREVNPSPERLDTFGNPFRRKSNSFVADEVYVDEMGMNNVPGGANAALINPSRRKQHASPPFGAPRSRGPLPSYINHLNWREFSPKHSLESPKSDTDNSSLDSCDSVFGANSKAPKHTTVSSKEAFVANEKLVRELTHIIRQPSMDGQNIFRRLNDLCGTLGQKYAAVSAVMSEALRFKRSSLYLLLRDWRTCALQDGSTLIPELTQRPHISKATGIQINGWG